MPLIDCNFRMNVDAVQNVRLRSLEFNWDDTMPAELASSEGFDLIIMSDVTYNTASFPPLLQALRSLLLLPMPDDRPTNIILAYKERDPKERELWQMAEKEGVWFSHVTDVLGHGGQPVEIWHGTCRRNPNVTPRKESGSND